MFPCKFFYMLYAFYAHQGAPRAAASHSSACPSALEDAQPSKSAANAKTAAPTIATETTAEIVTNRPLRIRRTPMPHYIRRRRGHARAHAARGAKNRPRKTGGFAQDARKQKRTARFISKAPAVQCATPLLPAAAHLPATAYISLSTLSTPLDAGSLSMFS